MQSPVYERKGVNIQRNPAVNVLSQEEFKERATVVFGIMDEILGRSFGPYGAQTLISDFPYTHATKDGFTIARYITFDHVAGSPVDRIIASMAMDICGRLNYAVGDGTTTAILSTNHMFRALSDEAFGEYSPKQIIRALNDTKNKIIDEFQSEITPVTDENLTDVISNVTRISSNDDEEISEMITKVYDEYRYPILRCDDSDRADTYLEMDEGYKCKVRLGDDVYINNQHGTGEFTKTYVIIFDHQVKAVTYQKIIEPLYTLMRHVNSTLVCIAPSYDSVALHNLIKRDVIAEYKNEKKSSLVIAVYPRNTDFDMQVIYDLAIVLNTTLVDRTLENEILEIVDNDPQNPFAVLNAINITDHSYAPAQAIGSMVENLVIGVTGRQLTKPSKDGALTYSIQLGFADHIIMGKKETIFKTAAYDEGLYQKCLEEAKRTLDETTQKFSVLGTYTTDVYNAQYRYSALCMKTAVIYVGGDSKLSQAMRADVVEDAVRAAESAFRNGYVLGGNISLIRAINRVVSTTHDNKLVNKIAEAFKAAFIGVYKRAFDNHIDPFTEEQLNECIETGCKDRVVFDLNTKKFSSDIINSAKTDIEILTATVDLLGILLTGNQVIISRYQHEIEEK